MTTLTVIPSSSFHCIRTASFVYDFHAAPLVDFFSISSGKTNQKKRCLIGAFQSFGVELHPKLLNVIMF
jgi:hypothetical protein